MLVYLVAYEKVLEPLNRKGTIDLPSKSRGDSIITVLVKFNGKKSIQPFMLHVISHNSCKSMSTIFRLGYQTEVAIIPHNFLTLVLTALL